MKTQKMLVSFVILGATGVVAYGQPGAGKAYDTRDPFSCKSKKEPAKGAPSGGQLKDLVLCSNERAAGGYIGLFQNLQVDIGKSRPYSAWSDSGNSNIDNSQPVYPIRGTAEFYSCRPPGSMGFPAGKNCQVKKDFTFQGTCFKTTFNDWSCPIQGTSDGLANVQSNTPPPK
jgi:hypothetical protein